MRQRWEAGIQGEVEGLTFRVVNGRKAPDDLRLEVWINAEWVPVPMGWGMLFADFFFENENVLYTPPAAGGGYYMGALWVAAKKGWPIALQRLHDEKAAKRAGAS